MSDNVKLKWDCYDTNPFSGLDHEKLYKHLTKSYGIAGMVGVQKSEEETLFLWLFLYSLISKVNECYLDQSM